MTLTYLHDFDLTVSLSHGDGFEGADGGSCVVCVADQQSVDRDLSRRLGDVILVHVPSGDGGTVDG
jgi:hypothetical protein